MSFLCFICHSTVNSDTPEHTREKYRDIVGINLCPDSHLCYICCHVLNKLWLFKSICLKRSLEYPVLFSEKGTINLHRSDLDICLICNEETCVHFYNQQKYIFIYENNYELESYAGGEEFEEKNKYVELYEDRKDLDDCFDSKVTYNFNDDKKKSTKENERFSEDFKDNSNHSVEDCIDETCGTFEDEEDNNDILKEYTDKANENKLQNVNDEEADLISQKEKSRRKKKHRHKKGVKTKIVPSIEEQKLELEARRKEKKYLEAEFKCYNCALGFLFKDSYQAHMMRHEESNGEHVCPTCTLRFASSRSLRAHITTHGTRRECVQCGRKGTHECDAPERICPYCDVRYKDGSSLSQHIRRFHHSKSRSRSYSCNVCGKTYHNQATMRTHMIKHTNKKFPCPQCSALFSSPYTLNQHKKKHTPFGDVQIRRPARRKQTNPEPPPLHLPPEIHVCRYCDKRYSTRKSMLRHERAHIETAEVKLAVCHLCGKSFKGNNKLNRHLREVCEKAKFEEELNSFYDLETNMQ